MTSVATQQRTNAFYIQFPRLHTPFADICPEKLDRRIDLMECLPNTRDYGPRLPAIAFPTISSRVVSHLGSYEYRIRTPETFFSGSRTSTGL
jgi:hypothetical protein